MNAIRKCKQKAEESWARYESVQNRASDALVGDLADLEALSDSFRGHPADGGRRAAPGKEGVHELGDSSRLQADVQQRSWCTSFGTLNTR